MTDWNRWVNAYGRLEAIHTSRVGPRLAGPVVIQYLTGGPGSRPADLQFHRANNSYPDLITASFIIFSFRSVELSSEMKPKYITTIFDNLNTDNSYCYLKFEKRLALKGFTYEI